MTQTILETLSSEVFKNDVTAVLSDGSAWEIAPSKVKKFQKWLPEEKVHITSRGLIFRNWSYRFILYNHKRKEGVEVKLIGHKVSPEPLLIAEIEELPVYKEVPEVRSELYYDSATDSWCSRLVFTGRVNIVLSRIDKQIHLTDRSSWFIYDSRKDYRIGEPVYIGGKGKGKKNYDFMLITGDWNNAYWEKAKLPRR